MSDLLKCKDQLRQAFLDRRSRLSTAVQTKAGRAVARRLLTRKEIFEALHIGLYWSFRGELPTRECFQKLRRGARTIYLPRAILKVGRLEFVKTDYEAQLIKGAWGILEPDSSLQAVKTQSLQAIIIPGVVFDIHGHRIGWGQGYYDRVLRGFKGKKVALAYDFQVLEHIPSGKQDVPVDIIVTESHIIECRKK